MAQQYITVITVADYGAGKSIIANPVQLLDFSIGKQEESPWLLYFSRWFDPWLMDDSLISPAKTRPKINFYLVQEDFYSFRPNKTVTESLKSSLRRKLQYKEQYWYNWNLIQATEAYSSILPKRKIFIIRNVVSASLSDSKLLPLLKQ